MRAKHLGGRRDRACVLEAPVDTFDDTRPVFDEIGNGGQKVVDVVDDRDIVVFSQEAVLRRRDVAVTPDMREGKFLVPSRRIHLAVGKLKGGNGTARKKGGENGTGANFGHLIVRCEGQDKRFRARSVPKIRTIKKHRRSQLSDQMLTPPSKLTQ